jgi:hypothetical protein
MIEEIDCCTLGSLQGLSDLNTCHDTVMNHVSRPIPAFGLREMPRWIIRFSFEYK